MQTQDNSRHKSKRRLVGIAALTLPATCISCFALALIGQQTQQSDPNISVTYVSQNPTVIAATFKPPTATPAPLPTLIPSETPEPSLFSSSEVAYFNEISKVFDIYDKALENINELYTQAAQFPSLIVSTEWRIRMAANLAMITTAGEMVRKLSPPASMLEVHTELVAASRHYDFAAEQTAKSLDNMDPSYLAEVRTSLETADKHLKKAQHKIKEIQKTRLRGG